MKEIYFVHTSMRCGVCDRHSKQEYWGGDENYPMRGKLGIGIGRSKICESCLEIIVKEYYNSYQLDGLSIEVREKEDQGKPKKELSEREVLRRQFSKSGRLRKRILERDAYRCLKCEDHLNLHVDHILPLSKGGDNSEDNLQTLCSKCNLSKGSKHIDYRKVVEV